MRLSDERLGFLAKKITKSLQKEGVLSELRENEAFLRVKKGMQGFGTLLEKIESDVEKKIATLKRNVPKGSSEWDIRHRQYFDEELAKKGLGRVAK